MLSEMNTFIKSGNLDELLSTVKYSRCPECSYNHPEIQGILVYEAQHSDNLLLKARSFYLLHIALRNKNLQIHSPEDKKKYSDLSDNFYKIFISLVMSNDENFETRKKEWESLYVSIPADKVEQINRLTTFRAKKKWMEFKSEYDHSPKYIDEATFLAKLAFNGKIMGTTPDMYLELANTQYYAEGYIAMGDYVYQKNLSYSIEMYKKALLVYNDIRGYERFVAINEIPTEEMKIKRTELERMHAQLKDELLRLGEFAV